MRSTVSCARFFTTTSVRPYLEPETALGGTMHCASSMFAGELCSRTRFSLAEILVLAGSAGAGGMAPPASTRISARLQRFLEHSSPVNIDEAQCIVPPSAVSGSRYGLTLVVVRLVN